MRVEGLPSFEEGPVYPPRKVWEGGNWREGLLEGKVGPQKLLLSNGQHNWILLPPIITIPLPLEKGTGDIHALPLSPNPRNAPT